MERFSAQIVSFIIGIVLARILMPDAYGVIAILMIFVNFANVIVDGGLNTALIQKKNADNIDFSTIFYVSMMLATVLYAILFFLSPIISNLYDNEKLTLLLRVLSLILFLNSFNAIQRAYVAKHMLFRQLFYSSFGAVVLSGFCGIFMAYNGFGEWALVAQQLVSQLATSILMWITIKWRPEKIFSLERFIGLFDYGWKIFLTNIVIALYENIRGIFIGKLYSPSFLAYFERGKSMPALFMENINSSIKTVLFPALSSEQDNRARVKQMMRRSMKLNCYVTFPLLVGLFVVADSLVIVLLTDKWLDAVPFIRIFCLAYMLMPIQISNIEAIKALGYSNVILKLEVIKKIIEAVILVVSFTISVYAVAWGVVLYNAVCLFINLLPNSKLLQYGVLEQLGDVALILLASIFMGLITWLVYCLNLSSILTLLLQVIFGIVAYVVISKILKIDSYKYIMETLKSIIIKK